MKKVLILSLALILLLGVAANGTFGLFSDAETSEGNTFTAWVEVCPPGSMIIVSDTDIMVTEAYTKFWSGIEHSPYTPHNAVYAWDGNVAWAPVSAYFEGLGEPEAGWIWETVRTDEPGDWDDWPDGWPSSSVTGRVVRFERTFSIPCSPQGATLDMTVDNGYTVWINGHLVGCAQVTPCEGWENYDLTEAHVHTSDWSTVEHYTIDSTDLVTGENVLVILAANEYMGHRDRQSRGTWRTNPAGLIYRLEVEWGG